MGHRLGVYYAKFLFWEAVTCMKQGKVKRGSIYELIKLQTNKVFSPSLWLDFSAAFD